MFDCFNYLVVNVIEILKLTGRASKFGFKVEAQNGCFYQYYSQKNEKYLDLELIEKWN